MFVEPDANKDAKKPAKQVPFRFRVFLAAGVKRGKTRGQVLIGSGFSSDWSGKWCEVFQPITKSSDTNPKET